MIAFADNNSRLEPPTVETVARLATAAIEGEGPVVVNDYTESEYAISGLVNQGVKSAMATLINSNASTSVLGVVVILSVKPNYFSSERSRMLTTVTGTIGGYLEAARVIDAERMRARETEALFNIASALVTPGCFNEKAQRVVQEIAAMTAGNRVPEEDGDGLVLVALAGTSSADGPPTQVMRGTGVSVAAFDRGQVIVENNYAESNFASERGLAQGLQSVIAMPIVRNDVTLGVITVTSWKPAYFTPERIRFFTVIRNNIGAHLPCARLLEAESQHALQQTPLPRWRISWPSQARTNRRRRALHTLVRTAQANSVVLRAWDEQRQELVLVASAGADIPGGLPIAVGKDSMAGAAFEQGRPVVVNDSAGERMNEALLIGAGIEAFAVIPVKASGKTLGVIGVMSSQREHFTPERLELLSVVGNGISSLLENAQLYQQISAELDQNHRTPEAFLKSATRLALEEEPDHALHSVVEAARSLVGAKFGGLALWNNDGSIEKWVASGVGGDNEKATDHPQGHLEIVAAVRAQARTVHIREAGREDSGVNNQAGGTPTTGPTSESPALGVPVLAKDGAAGVLFLAGKDSAARFTDDDERLLNLFAALSGVLLSNIGLYGEVIRERRALAAVQESIAEGLVVLNSENRVTYFNPAAAALIAFVEESAMSESFEHLLSVNMGDFDIPADAHLLANLVADVRTVAASVDISVVRPQHRQLAVTAFPISVGPSERLTGVLMRDISSARALERRRDAFVSVASHELRTPVTTIQGFAALLLNRTMPERIQREWLGYIVRDSHRITEIVEDLLDVSRIQSGDITLNMKAYTTDDIVAEALKVAAASAPNREIVADATSDSATIWADHDKVVQVLAQLIDNAAKYSPEEAPLPSPSSPPPAPSPTSPRRWCQRGRPWDRYRPV